VRSDAGLNFVERLLWNTRLVIAVIVVLLRVMSGRSPE